MTVTRTELLPGYPDGAISVSEHTYVAKYQVYVDDVDDGPHTVATASGIPALGSTYAIGNDTDEKATLNRVTPKRSSAVQLKWLVDCQWGPPEEDDKQRPGADGALTDEPTLWADRIRRGKQKVTEPVEEAWNITDLPAIGRAPGTKGPICNSAGVVLDPTLESERSLNTYQITKYLAQFPEQKSNDFTDWVNSDGFSYTNALANYNKQFLPFTALCESITGAWQFNGGAGKSYWEVDFVLIEDPKTWRVQIVDRGHGRVWDQNYDGPKPANDPNAPDVVELFDVFDQPLKGPVLLDGFGWPLGKGQPARYITWRIKGEKPFAGLFAM